MILDRLPTIFQRMKELNLSVKGLFSPATDQEFDTLVSEIKIRSLFHGNRMVKGNLEAAGYRVQWTRVRSSMHRVDSAGNLVTTRKNGLCGPPNLPCSLPIVHGTH